jgi:hypothetical protein
MSFALTVWNHPLHAETLILRDRTVSVSATQASSLLECHQSLCSNARAITAYLGPGGHNEREGQLPLRRR